MTRGRGKNAPDRSDLVASDGVALAQTEPVMCPEHLPDHAQSLWVHLMNQTYALRLIKPEDLFLLESLCMQYQMFRDAQQAYSEKGLEERLREETEAGSKRNTEIDIMTKTNDQMVKIAKIMGISPLVRSQMNLHNAAAASLMATDFPNKVKKLYEAANGKSK